MTELTDRTKRGMSSRPIEAAIVGNIYDALAAAGTPLKSVDFGEGPKRIESKEDLLNWAFNLDELTAHTEGSFVYLVMGQDWDTLADYGMSLDEALKPVMSDIERGMLGGH